ncbi:hypothetical protein [Streptomyces sp. NPDC053431]|uniref:hypothetical protein n=1 Tax=Streptomyces sp. NPDC053431 TaxID=3365703 RepID=UPI0037D81B83
MERQRGVEIRPARLSLLLKADGFRYKRTRTTVRHRADEALQQIAKAQLEDLRLLTSTTWTRPASRRPCPPATPGPASARGRSWPRKPPPADWSMPPRRPARRRP